MKKALIVILALLGVAVQSIAQDRKPVTYIYTHAQSFENGLAMVAGDNGKWFFINKNGEAVTQAVYDNWFPNWSEGLKAVKRNGKYGFIDTSGKEIIPCNLSGSVGEFHEGLAKIVNPDWSAGYIDMTGRIVIPCIYGSEASDFSDGLAAVRKGNSFIYINKAGRQTINKSFFRANAFSEGLAHVVIFPLTTTMQGGRVTNLSQKKYAYVNKTGNIVFTVATTSDFIMCHEFHEGLAAVEKDRKYGYINKTGRLVIPYAYEYAGDFKNGVAIVKKVNGEEITINKLGRQVADASAIRLVRGNGTAYFTDKNGNKLFDETFDAAEPFSEGFACVKKNGRWGYIDEQGNGLEDSEKSLRHLEETSIEGCEPPKNQQSSSENRQFLLRGEGESDEYFGTTTVDVFHWEGE